MDKKALCIVLVAIFMLANCGHVQREKFDRAQLKAAKLKFGQAIDSGNIDDIANMYTKDAMIMPNFGKIVRSRAEIKEFWKSDLVKQFISRNDVEVEMDGYGDIAYEVTQYEFEYQQQGRESTWMPSKNVHIWKRTMDGTWKLHIDIWNNSMSSFQN